MPPKGGCRPWVKDAFDGIPSATAGSYTPAAAAARAALRSGQHLILKLNTPCPPVTKTDCSGHWLSWGECEGDGQKAERFTVDQWPLAGGAPCMQTMAACARHHADQQCGSHGTILALLNFEHAVLN